MKTLSIDIETFSGVPLTTWGVYKYAESSDFEILLFAYAIDGGTVKVVDLARGEVIPKKVLDALVDDKVLKYAYNAQFERICLSKYLAVKYLNPKSWRCTSVWASTLGLPQSLGAVAQVLNLGEDKQKMQIGKSLISYFCQPCRPTKVNGGRTRNLPSHDLEKWKLFKEYCKRDVEVELAIQGKIVNFPVTAKEWLLYEKDQLINDKGLLIDTGLVDNLLEYNNTYLTELMEEAGNLTGLSNPNSLAQLKGWLSTQGVEVESLTKDAMKNLLIKELPTDVRRVLEIRQQLGKTSVKKFETMKRVKCSDNRVRGTLQFYGANRTGRWAGRLIQVQNLPRNADDIATARKLVATSNFDMLELLYEDLSSVFSQLVRPAIIPSKNKKYIVSDFSAIEARVIAWLSKEKWRMDVFAGHGRIYEASASQMFNIPLEDITKDLRQKGKVSELALGYGGGPGALMAMGALDMGVKEEELQGLVDAWRSSNTQITKLWKEMNSSALECVRNHSRVNTSYGINFHYTNGIMFIELPSGRKLAYVKPHITENRFGSDSIGYWGVDQTKKVWARLETYGGKLVENIVQAIARDLLAEAILKVSEFENIVMHVHDEIVVETDKYSDVDVKRIEDIMREPIEWAKGLILGCESFAAEFYQK